MEPEINKIVGEATKAAVKEATKEAKKEEVIETATKMLKSGEFTIEKIHEFIPRLSVEEIGMLEIEWLQQV